MSLTVTDSPPSGGGKNLVIEGLVLNETGGGISEIHALEIALGDGSYLAIDPE